MIAAAGRIVLIFLSGAMLLALVRLVRGPSLADRVIALDLISTLAAGMVGAYVIVTNQPVVLDTAIVISLVTFLGTVAFARYLERRGPRTGDSP